MLSYYTPALGYVKYNIAKKIHVSIANNTDSPSLHRPQLALAAMNVIAEWSILESFVMSLFVQMIGDNPKPASAMFASLKSDTAKRDCLRAVANSTLETQQKKDVFEAILKAIKSASKHRNKIVHWIWGYSKDFPDAVLLMRPEDKVRQNVADLEHKAVMDKYYQNVLANMLQKKKPPNHPGFSDQGIFIFEKKDFIEASKLIQRAMYLVVTFRFVLMPNHPANQDDKLLKRLLNEPEIRTFLARLKQRRKNNQKAEK